MPSKKQIHSDGKATAEPRSSRRGAQNFETLTHKVNPLAVIQRDRLYQRALTPQDVLQLQHTIGNQAFSRLLQGRPSVQREAEEEEQLQTKSLVQRQELEQDELQIKPDIEQAGVEGGQVDLNVEVAINQTCGGGQPLEGAVQKQMSETLGYDFSRVRVHTGSESDALNQQLTAKAFTTGPDIFFKRGAYDPISSRDRELIAHELTHVVKQGTGRVSGHGSGMTIRRTGDVFEQEADAQARRATGEGPYRKRDLPRKELQMKALQPRPQEKEKPAVPKGEEGKEKERKDGRKTVRRRVEELGWNGRVSKALQRFPAAVLVKDDKSEFQPVAGDIVSTGNLNDAFGITYPMDLQGEGEELKGAIWKHAGLKEGRKDVEDEATTGENWKQKIEGLASLGDKGVWYTREAVEKHEEVHANSFKEIANSEEKTIKEAMKKARKDLRLKRGLAIWRSKCDRKGGSDHSSGRTDSAELPVVVSKITKVWENKVAADKKAEVETKGMKQVIKSAYKKKILGKGKKTIRTLTLKPDGSVE